VNPASPPAQLSELGSRFEPAEGIKIDGIVAAKAPASAYTASKRFPWEL
jgi:hypothetical protein